MPSRLLACIIILTAFAAQAETADDAQDQLSDTLSAIKTTSQKQKELEKKRSALEEEMKTLQKETATLALDAKTQEEALLALEEKARILDTQKKEKQNTLNARKAELSEALAAMLRLSRLPPEAVIAMPGKMQETLSAARALRVITKAVEDESASLRAQLRELDALEEKITQNRKTLLGKQAGLTQQKQALNEKINARGKMQAALNGKADEAAQHLQHLTAKSKSLQDLVDVLGHAEEKEDEEQPLATKEPAAAPVTSGGEKKLQKARAFTQAKGRIGLPVAGKIVGLYGHSEGGAAFSKGMVIEARASGNVVAPFDGEVVYAGTFRDYGKMVILRHKGNYHTLLSGMEEINCTVGQFLLEGEPIGAMGMPSDGGKPRLYVEMRKSGKPIDPMSWFKS